MTFCMPKVSMPRHYVVVSYQERTYGLGGDVRQISTNTRGVDDIVEGKLVNKRAELQEQRQRL